MNNEWNKGAWKGKGKCSRTRDRWTMNEIEVWEGKVEMTR